MTATTHTDKPQDIMDSREMHPTFNWRTKPWETLTEADFATFPTQFCIGRGHRWNITIYQRGESWSASYDSYLEAKAVFLKKVESADWHCTVVLYRYCLMFAPYWGGKPYLSGRVVCSVECVVPEPVYEVFGGIGEPMQIVNIARGRVQYVASVSQVMLQPAEASA